ncbi:MAG TPA: Rieske 2Fe-2S domain-containing protein [Stenomitos sp.]
MRDEQREVSRRTGPSGPPVERWRLEFPFHWDADELVSRRELLAFTVYASATIFGATGLLALLGLRPQPTRSIRTPVVRIDEVPEGEAHYFRYPGEDDQAVLLNLPGRGFVAYSQRCTHLSCTVYYQADRSRLYCPCHEGVFNPMTGDPVAGPPRRRLGQIILDREGDTLYAVALVP